MDMTKGRYPIIKYPLFLNTLIYMKYKAISEIHARWLFS